MAYRKPKPSSVLISCPTIELILPWFLLVLTSKLATCHSFSFRIGINTPSPPENFSLPSYRKIHLKAVLPLQCRKGKWSCLSTCGMNILEITQKA